MPDVVHSEQEGEWLGHVWRRKETPDQITQYYWSLSFTGDMREMHQQHASQDGSACPAAFVPDSCYYPSEHQAKQDLQEELKRHGSGGRI
jgi:hypothetical protein